MPDPGSRIRELSGGMVRRVALAQALVSRPDVVLLDEPSTGLDPEQRRAMIRLVKALDVTVLFSSHVIEDVEDVADRILVLEQGKLCFDGRVDELKARTPGRGPGDSDAGRREAGFLGVLAEFRHAGRPR